MWRWLIVGWGIMMVMVSGVLGVVRAGGPSTAQWIAFVADESLYIVSSDGGVLKKIDEQPIGYFRFLEWQGDNLHYLRDVRGATISSQVISVHEQYNPYSGAITRLHDVAHPSTPAAMPPPLDDFTPEQWVVDADGEWLVMVARNLRATTTRQIPPRAIYRVRTDGTDLLRLTDPLTFIDVYDPAFSPDGRHIVFSGMLRNDVNLFMVGIDGGTPQQLTRNASYDQTAHFSIDGQWIIFASDRTGYVQLYRVPAGGFEPDVQAITDFEADINRNSLALSPPVAYEWSPLLGLLGAVVVVLSIKV